MQLYHCMSHDTLWVTLTIILDVAVAAGYGVITTHWWKNQRMLPVSPARTALANMRNIFMFCGICGYAFIPIKMVWPAWRLYDLFMLALVFYTWRYALNAKDLRVIYTAVGRSDKLAADLAESREESKRKTFFLNAISHDLRTPLNGLILQANLAELHAAGGDNTAVTESIEQIKAAARRTADMLDGLLEYARLDGAGDSLNESEFDLSEIIRDTMHAHAAMAARKSLALRGAGETGLLVCTDRLKLDRILNNLLSNAIKFTASGSITVDVERVQRNVQIHVIDTGAGIAPEHRARLFEEFFQVHNDERDRQKGFGLGLAICKRLVQQLGGELRVHSTPGLGSRFTVVLPEVVSASRPQQASGHPAFEQSGAVNDPGRIAGAAASGAAGTASGG